MAKAAFTIRFWGVRGSFPRPGPATLRYGGNTSCVELRCGKRLVILDGGTGLAPLGESLAAGDAPDAADILYSHTHFDHVIGLPFFAPARRTGTVLRLWGGHLKEPLGQALHKIFSPPLMPITPSDLGARLECRDFRAGDTLNLEDGILAATAPLNHPNGATGYRLSYAGKTVAYVTDTEHSPGSLDENVLRLARGADLMIYDSTYDDRDFDRHAGHGHSTWQEAIRLAAAAGVRRLALFHHHPQSDDDTLDARAAAAKALFPESLVAREGLALEL